MRSTAARTIRRDGMVSLLLKLRRPRRPRLQPQTRQGADVAFRMHLPVLETITSEHRRLFAVACLPLKDPVRLGRFDPYRPGRSSGDLDGAPLGVERSRGN